MTASTPIQSISERNHYVTKVQVMKKLDNTGRINLNTTKDGGREVIREMLGTDHGSTRKRAPPTTRTDRRVPD